MTFTAPRRKLVFPLYNQLANEVETDDSVPFCDVPVFPEDSDEKSTVLFRLSLNEFVAIASAIDAGIDIAFGIDAIKVWQLWSFAYMCAQFCDEVAACLTSENPAVIAALAELIASNPTIRAALSAAISELGGAVPGQPLTSSQAAADFLPENVKDEFGDCDNDALWGACLFLVQSGNRAITDFFEIVEEQTNALETSAIVVGAIPAAGDFAEAGLEFADQLLENISEGYAAAYTEEYETGLACEIFCLAQANNCELSADMLVDIMSARLSFTSPGDFGDVMSGIGGAIYPGVNIPDSAFYIYFTALRFGQKFLDVIGFRPLTDLMSLGADQLASDNWQVLCDCPDFWNWDFPEDEDMNSFTLLPFAGATATTDGTTIEAVEDVPPTNNMFSNFEIVVDGDVTRVDVHFTTDVDIDAVYEYRLYIDEVLEETEVFEDDGSFVLSWSGVMSGEHTYRFLTGARGSPGDGNFLSTTEVIFFGTGTNPFV